MMTENEKKNLRNFCGTELKQMKTQPNDYPSITDNIRRATRREI